MMAELRFISDAEAKDLLAGKGSWRQYPAYAAQAARRIGARSRYALIKQDGTAVALANLRTKQVAAGVLSSTLISHGPVFLGEPTQAALDTVVRTLRQRISGEEKGELVIDPDPFLAELDLRIANDTGKTTVSDGYRTIVLDISRDEELIQAGFHGKWRTDWRRAGKEGLELRSSGDPDEIERMEPLLDELARTKGFAVPQDAAFFAEAARQAGEGERFIIQQIWKDGELLSGHIGAYSGDTAVYLLGATSERGRPLRAAYLAQWGAILTAKSLGITRYDLGGIDPEENPAVYRFKNRMGGTEIVSPAPVTYKAGGWRGPLLGLAKAVYAKGKRI
ncbi:hypothetical protein HME9302_00877 [Alteripontixanthobacter maritimus]|uniref:BioF2-like acetyltransferase domain-containing protein n=1 Tax=Alteripontixanthobacter maritimus TaxID=2161824 RepID=A0A369Q832_9SPHN|nr:GNAT family N-acetyltransferase [Alteripontixanthobacter maritimus]RDC59685.1 hypothetical protein HME9302_00877 [Alteripontixanthobacter maritimus]